MAQLTAANENDISEAVWLVEGLPTVAGHPGHPRQLPDRLYADKAYDSEPFRQYLKGRRIEPHIPRRRKKQPRGLGKRRWVVERTLAWLHQFRRLRIRWERRDDIHEAFLSLGCAMICWRTLKRSL